MPNFPDRRHNNFDVWQAKKGAKPSNPEAGAVKLYPDAEGNIKKIDENGNESSIGGSGTGSPSTFYLENYESNSPTDLFTVTGSWTLENDTDTSSKLCEKQSVKLIQVSGSLGAIAEVKGLLVPNRSIGPSIGKRLEYEYDGNTNDIYVQILESSDGTNYTIVGGDNGALFLPKSLNNGIGELQGYFKETSTHYGYRFTVATENIGAILKVGTISFEIDPKVTAEFVQSGSIKADPSSIALVDLGGGQGALPMTSGSQYDEESNGLWKITSNALDFLQDCTISYGWSVIDNLANRAGFIKLYDSSFNLIKDLNADSAGANLWLSAGGSFNIKAGQKIRFATNGYNTDSTLNSARVTLSATKKSSNVIFKGAEVNNTVTTDLGGVNITPAAGTVTITQLTQQIVEGQWYEFDFSAEANVRVGFNTITAILSENGNELIRKRHSNGNTEGYVNWGLSKRFKATATGDFTVQFIGFNGSDMSLYDDSGQTFLQLTPTEPPLLSVPLNDVVAPTIKETISDDVTTDTVFKTITGLEVGKTYYYKPSFNMLIGSGDGTVEVVMRRPSGGAIIKPLRTGNGGGSASNETLACCFEFTAQDTSVELQSSSFGAGTTLYAADTVIQIEEKKNEGIFSVNAPLSNGQSNATPYWTGRMLDGRKIMSKTFHWTGTQNTIPSSTIVLDTIGTNLDVVNISGSVKRFAYGAEVIMGLSLTEGGTSANLYTVYYDTSSREIRSFLSKDTGSDWEVREIYFTIEYLQ